MTALLDDVERCCQRAAALDVPGAAARAAAITDRLHEPLRVAIAGRVKAGKSTLLNALVGERLAPTDAGECTRLVTWYRHGADYQVTAELRDGTSRELRYQRRDGALAVDLGALDVADVEALEVRWPVTRLASMTLIDTPGLESLDEDRVHRTRVLLGVEDEATSQVDAVVYLMRHLHRTDADFLEAFLDHTLSRPSPVNAVAVLSRADEVGAARLDALDSAAAIARRMAADDRVRALCATVLPVAGLLAETGATLREEEVRDLRILAAGDPAELEAMLLSVERFCAAGVSERTTEVRRDLLWRFGLFGVRFALAALGEGRATTATDLSRQLLDASGIDDLVELLDTHLGRRARTLKARSALVALRSLATEAAVTDPSGAAALIRDVERVEAGAHELAMLRLLHLLMSGTVSLEAEERAEVERLAGDLDDARDAGTADRLGLDPAADVHQQREVALQRIEAWRTRAAHPLTDRASADACEIVASAYEHVHAQLTA